jgi:EAL domain-containing protein (putative c-di-GMP-specific phosphodiesterase class I)
MASFQKPFLVNNHELQITTSIGISVYPDDSTERETLFRYADIALYQAKAMNRNTYQFYNPGMNLRTIEKLKIESYLRYTLERGELLVYYQPQFELKTGKQLYAEALVRWQHPELGLLDPERFMPTAEDTGFVTNIDEWVMATACAQFKSWVDAGLHPPCLTVNLSAKEFKNAQLSSTIKRILSESGLAAVYLEIEIAETVAMQNIDYTIECFQELSAAGISISLDHFGIGYSSLNLLKRLPLKRLKIDQVFIKEIATNPDDQAIVRAITTMAHNMQFLVVAEGVETYAQLNYLRANECDQAQGNLLSQPLPADKFKARLLTTTVR